MKRIKEVNWEWIVNMVQQLAILCFGTWIIVGLLPLDNSYPLVAIEGYAICNVLTLCWLFIALMPIVKGITRFMNAHDVHIKAPIPTAD